MLDPNIHSPTLHAVCVLLGARLDGHHDRRWVVRDHVEVRHRCELVSARLLSRKITTERTFASPFSDSVETKAMGRGVCVSVALIEFDTYNSGDHELSSASPPPLPGATHLVHVSLGVLFGHQRLDLARLGVKVLGIRLASQLKYASRTKIARDCLDPALGQSSARGPWSFLACTTCQSRRATTRRLVCQPSLKPIPYL